MKYISPKPLKKGARLAIIAPASPFNPEQLYAGIQTLNKCGMEVVMGDNTFFLRHNNLYAANLSQRIEEFRWAIEDDSIDGIICATGGFGSAQLLPHLPYNIIAQKRKPIMGFSDITALNTAILSKSGLINFNGPTASILTDDKNDATALEDAINLLMNTDFWGNQPFVRNKTLPQCVSAGKSSGPAIGGNLSTFTHLLGTPYFPNVEGAILFMEDIHESSSNVVMYFQQLALAGIFDKLAGIVIGTFTQRPEKLDPIEPSIEQIIVEYLKDGPPCIYGLNFSHNPICAIIPIGTHCIVDANKLQVMFDSPFDNI
mgnify:CR=1 FL=1